MPRSQRRLDQELVARGLVASRSQAESYIRLGKVLVDGQPVQKSGTMVGPQQKITLNVAVQYVSRAALKLASVADALSLEFRDKVVLDVGSSTGGFTDYALKNGAKKVIAVDVGTGQLHPSLRADPRVELHEKTDIRTVSTAKPRKQEKDGVVVIQETPDVVLIDVSFISLREILPGIAKLSSPGTAVVAMVKPQFEAGTSSQKHKGVIKNDRMRRDILKDFEAWAQKLFVIVDKADSDIAGAKGNRERFYLLQPRRLL